MAPSLATGWAGGEEEETKLYNFFLPSPVRERIQFAAFNNLILTGTNNFART